jgi:hypothetical protein
MDKYACRISVKTRTCFHGFTYVFLGIHVRVFGNSRTCFWEFTYVFSEKHVRIKNKSGKIDNK